MSECVATMQLEKPASAIPKGLLQRKCACGQHTIAGAECEECRQKREGMLQRAAMSPGAVSTVPPIVHEVLSSPGQALDTGTRAFMEPRFGHDFSQVRVHTDEKAAESARSVNALAYTVGRDVVFGRGQYVPGTSDGKRLLAHELAHTVQQSHGQGADQQKTSVMQVNEPGDRNEQSANQIADAVIQTEGQHPSRLPIEQLRTSFMLQRQTPAPSQPGSQTAPSTSSGWQGCPPDKIGGLNSELADAVSWTSEAVTDLQNTNLPAHTSNALSRYLSTNTDHISNIILPKLKQMLGELNQGPSAFQCQTQAQCLALNPNAANASALASYPISLCPPYFSRVAVLSGGSLVRTATLIHECGHHAGLGGDTYEWTWPFPGLSINDRLSNADSFAAFVVSNHHPTLPPFQGQVGIQLASGVLFPAGAAQPRFVVTAEYDTTLAQRIFHFFDLHLSTRVDVDSAGAILLTTSLGTRFFSPLSLTRAPLFLDLRAGLAYGNDPTAIARGIQSNILGPSGEARIGILRGHFEGSIDYLHIWNLMSKNADINVLTVNGAIHF